MRRDTTGGAEGFRWPPSPYLPGKSPRPDDSIFDGLKAGLGPGLPAGELAGSTAFRGGMEAFGRGYYWEAHELWEAVWMCLPAASAERHLMQGIIQLANAGLKRRLGRKDAAKRILGLAENSLKEAFLSGRGEILGLTRRDTDAMADRLAKEDVENA